VIAATIAAVASIGAVVAVVTARLRFSPPPQARSVSLEAHLPERPQWPGFPAVLVGRGLAAHVGAVQGAAFSPNGLRLLTASADETAKIWDVRRNKPLHVLRGHSAPVLAVRATADGRFAVTAGDRTARVWSVADGKAVRTFEADAERVLSVAVSPTGQTVAAGDSAGNVEVWGIDGSRVATLAHGGSRVLAAAFTPDGSRLVTAGDDATVKVWDVADWRLRRTLAGHAGAVNDLAVAPDGQLLASGGDDRVIRLWRLDADAPVAALALHAEPVVSLAFSRDGAFLVSGARDEVLGLWAIPAATLRQQVDLGVVAGAALGVAFAPDGASFVTTHGNGVVRQWELARSGSHLPVPVPSVVAAPPLPASAPADRRAYAEAMDLLDGEGPRLPEAEARLSDLGRSTPPSALACAGLARVALVRAQHAQGVSDERTAAEALARAVDLSVKAIAIDPVLPEAYVWRASALEASHDATGARVAADAARRLAPAMSASLLLTSRLAIDDGDLERAGEVLSGMLGRPLTRGDASAALAELAGVYERMSDVDAADQAWRLRIDVEPESARARADYARLLSRRGQHDAAMAMAREAMARTAPDAASDAGVRRTLAATYCRAGVRDLWDLGDADAALRAFEEAARADAGQACAAFGLGAYHQYVAAGRGDTAQVGEAMRQYTRAEALDPAGDFGRLARRAIAGLRASAGAR
jgi:tetratricopeptide (TPR) repeat protein